MTANKALHGRYLGPGTPVLFDGFEDHPEYGVVIHCWLDDEIQGGIAMSPSLAGDGPPEDLPRNPTSCVTPQYH